MAIRVTDFEPDRLTPAVETSVFDDNPDVRFWIGLTAMSGIIEKPIEYHASQRLRANVYIDELNWLPPSARNSHGLEADEYDQRSVEFATIENNSPVRKLVGTVRLIEKRHEADQLPVEKLFPEVFDDKPAEIGAVEISRLIARHPEDLMQHYISLGLIRAIDLHAVKEGVPNSYAVVEKPLQRYLRMIGVPYEQLTDYKIVESYGSTLNTAIRINPQAVKDSALSAQGRQAFLRSFFASALENNGLGHYSDLEA